ncbi:MAG: MBL fold metallo-hydrolase [Gemmatimonadales bacterium]
MTTLASLGSGSSGNAFVLEGADGALLIDAGFSARELGKRADRIGLDLGRLVGIVLTHEHGDHASGAARLSRQLGVPVVATEGTLRALGLADDAPRIVLRSSSITEVGPFCIESCRTLHDAAEPTALAVELAGVRVGIAYDFGRPTAGLRHLLRGSDALIIESNYDEVLLRTSEYPASVQHRIAGSGGHLSNRAAADLIGEVYHRDLALVVLAHLSRQCNAPEVAHATVAEALAGLGFRGRIAVAVQDAAVGPLPLRPSGAKERLLAQVELELL